MRLLFLGPKSSLAVLIRYRSFIIFGEKIHPVRLLNTVCLLNLDFFLIFFLDFSTKTSQIFFFLCQFYQFSPFSLLLKLHRVFISSCAFIKILVFFHPVCLFSTVRLLKLGGSSTLCVYSIPCYYSIL